MRRGARIAAGEDHDALHPVRGRLGERAAAELVVVLHAGLTVLGRRLQRRERGHEVVGDPVPERGDRAVITAQVVLRAAVRFVGHAAGALERRPLVPVAGIEEVEHAAHEILPAVAVERRRVAAPVRLEPLRRLRRQVEVYRLRDRWEEERGRRGVVVHQHLRVPAQDPVHHRADLGLALRQEIAVHVEAKVIVAARDAPRLVLLQGGRVVGADADGVVPGGEPLVTVGVGGWVEHEDDVLQDRQRLRLVRGEHLVCHLHRGLEARRLVAVHRVLEQHDRRIARGDVRRAGGRGLAGIGELGNLGADLVEPGEVRRIGNDERADRPAFRRLPPPLDAHPLGCAGDERVEVALQLGVHRVLLPGGIAEDRLRAWHGGPVRAAVVEVEVLRSKRGREQYEQQGRAHPGAPFASTLCRPSPRFERGKKRGARIYFGVTAPAGRRAARRRTPAARTAWRPGGGRSTPKSRAFARSSRRRW